MPESCVSSPSPLGDPSVCCPGSWGAHPTQLEARSGPGQGSVWGWGLCSQEVSFRRAWSQGGGQWEHSDPGPCEPLTGAEGGPGGHWMSQAEAQSPREEAKEGFSWGAGVRQAGVGAHTPVLEPGSIPSAGAPSSQPGLRPVSLGDNDLGTAWTPAGALTTKHRPHQHRAVMPWGQNGVGVLGQPCH